MGHGDSKTAAIVEYLDSLGQLVLEVGGSTAFSTAEALIEAAVAHGREATWTHLDGEWPRQIADALCAKADSVTAGPGCLVFVKHHFGPNWPGWQITLVGDAPRDWLLQPRGVRITWSDS